jgi:hypothetical protein
MNEIMKQEGIALSIKSTMKAVNINLEIKSLQTGVNMTYNFIYDYVGFDIRRIVEARREMQMPVSLDVYIKALTIHELGHAMDRKALMESLPRTIEIAKMKKIYPQKEMANNLSLFALIIEEHEMNIAFEKTAWMNAEKLNGLYQIVEWDIFEKMKIAGLETYNLFYEEDLRLYSKLKAAGNQSA